MCNQYQPTHTESRKGYTITVRENMVNGAASFLAKVTHPDESALAKSVIFAAYKDRGAILKDARQFVDRMYAEYLANLDAYFERFDICQAYAVLEPAYSKGGWLQDRPSNRRRREACSIQLARLNFRPGAAFDYRYEDLTENGRAILHLAISRMNLPDWFTAAMEPAPEDV